MSGEIERLGDQLQRSFEGAAWHGSSLMEALEGITAEQASEHPIAGAHSIWEIVMHLAGSYRLVLRRMGGDDSPFTVTEDWPAIPSIAESDWSNAIAELRRLNRELREHVLRFDPARLDEPLVRDPDYTAYTQFIGITQHDLFHTGQIVLLKKCLV